MNRSIRRLAVLLACLPSFLQAADAPEPEKISFSDRLPFGRPPVDYFSQQTNDAVSNLQKSIDDGKVDLKADPTGYLRAVLQALDVPESSQLVVFSKTARAPNLVTPQTPRAIYFNDDVSVAWIPESRELELTAIDPIKGATFYTLSQPLSNGTDTNGPPSPIRFQRRDRCLACHAGQSSLGVPGLLLRAFQTDRTGKPLFGFSRITHETNYNRRWGGWYVTGAPPQFTHSGNLTSRAHNDEHKSNPGFRSSLPDIRTSVDLQKYPYLTDSSDVIAHMVFAHQMHGLNLLIRVGLESRLNRRSDAEEHLLRYLVFADEPPLPVPLDITDSAFATWFENQSKTDKQDRSLRTLDLKSRLLKYRLSWLIEHSCFLALPTPTRERLLTRLWSGLTATPVVETFAHLPLDERKAIINIVHWTVPHLPTCWHE